jgi:FdrA protein
MLFSVIKRGVFQDSISLMLLTRRISTLEGVDRVSIMMGTPANKGIFASTGFLTPEIDDAGPTDLCIALEAASAAMIDPVVEAVDAFLADQSVQREQADYAHARTFYGAHNQLPQANLALISVSGNHAAREARRALSQGLNAFIFSDNVSVRQERELKAYAHRRGLLVMGPDCGTGALCGLPLAFCNVTMAGAIGIVGASGTGTQAVMAGVDALGEGISHAIGIGGRDLSPEVGGISALDAIDLLARDPATEVIVFLSKLPAASVRERVVAALEAQPKPAVALFMGERAAPLRRHLHFAGTLEDAARQAVACLRARRQQVLRAGLRPAQQRIRGLFCGGTLASEAAGVLARGLGVPLAGTHDEGVMFDAQGHSVIDLGDDAYTVGRAHPMIDPSLRSDMLRQAALDPDTAVVLFDVVLGCGAHEDPAAMAVAAMEDARARREPDAGRVIFVASVCGTRQDPQDLARQIAALRAAHIWVETSNSEAAAVALQLASLSRGALPLASDTDAPSLLARRPAVINVGLRAFADDLWRCGAAVAHVDWVPPAGDDAVLLRALDSLN